MVTVRKKRDWDELIFNPKSPNLEHRLKLLRAFATLKTGNVYRVVTDSSFQAGIEAAIKNNTPLMVLQHTAIPNSTINADGKKVDPRNYELVEKDYKKNLVHMKGIKDYGTARVYIVGSVTYLVLQVADLSLSKIKFLSEVYLNDLF